MGIYCHLKVDSDHRRSSIGGLQSKSSNRRASVKELQSKSFDRRTPNEELKSKDLKDPNWRAPIKTFNSKDFNRMTTISNSNRDQVNGRRLIDVDLREARINLKYTYRVAIMKWVRVGAWRIWVAAIWRWWAGWKARTLHNAGVHHPGLTVLMLLLCIQVGEDGWASCGDAWIGFEFEGARTSQLSDGQWQLIVTVTTLVITQQLLFKNNPEDLMNFKISNFAFQTHNDLSSRAAWSAATIQTTCAHYRGVRTRR